MARTPASPRDPGVLTGPPPGRAAGPAASSGRVAATRAQLGTLAEALLDQPTYQQRWRQNLALTRILDWLETFPGEDWQDRWLLSGAEDQGRRWGPRDLTPALRNRLTAGLGIMIVLRAVWPSYAWLSSSRLLGVYASFRRHNQAEVFAAVERSAARHKGHEYAAEAVNGLTRMVIVTGKPLRELDLADFGDYAAARQACGSKVTALPMAYELLRAVGGLDDLPPTLREASARGQLSVAELVDRYPVANKEIRDVLVHYLVERSAALDYGSLVNLVQVLVDLFWRDLERHHPGICSLHLPDPVAQAWKQRIRTLPNGQARRTFHSVLLAVRAFYLDLLQWSLEDPARWARWAAPSPVGEADIRGYIKEARRRQARMQQRTRTLIPVLPQLIAAAENELDAAGRMLSAARDATTGDGFTIDGLRYRRTGRASSTWRPGALFVTPVDQPGPRFDAERLEDNAFWTFAAMEVLRRTGTRIEELLELTHVSLRQYQAPTGEMVPLLQVSPSKTDAERVIPAAPELVAVLARIIRRIKRDGTVPLLSRYDGYESTFGPLLPHLFQRVTHHQLQVIPPDRIRELLAGLARRAGITDIDGTPLKFTPHDFRRIFSTETVNGGLPIHIAAKLLGHLDLNTTQGYVAVYPEEVIRLYRQFVDQRRAHRPSEEYREPTDSEWEEFRDHFSLRKVALGRCGRPYGTPCQHESACVRCPMLRMSLSQVPRLLEIERNTHERLDEARRLQWLGEVTNLQESLRHIADKRRQAERLRRQHADQGESGENALS
ncbi:tyrosine-type recombinase/integrase [Streptomyces sp. NPDC057474]|uniref:tyrosine-type recombinase/integrase n=1 Tax=Streptomyces sp. NPDC057474 TaxID=3346144 RepID=UPI003698F7EF